jgi:hypothetical protein
MSTATDELIAAYLAELEREAARLPWNARTELLEDVRSHIEVAVAEIREVAESGSAAADGRSPDGESVGVGRASDGDSLGVGRASDRELLGVGRASDEVSQVRAMLSALGEPAEIVAVALADNPAASGAPSATSAAGSTNPGAFAGAEPYAVPTFTRQSPPYPLGTAEISAVALLLLGGFMAGIGWVVGAVLLWTSTRWTRAEKLIGTVVLPGGIGGGLFLLMLPTAGSSTNCSELGQCVTVHTGWDPPGWLSASMLLAVVLAPAITAVFLVNRAHQRPGTGKASRAGLAVIAGLGTLGLLVAVGLVAATSSGSVSPAGHFPQPAVVSGNPNSGYAVPISSSGP